VPWHPVFDTQAIVAFENRNSNGPAIGCPTSSGCPPASKNTSPLNENPFVGVLAMENGASGFAKVSGSPKGSAWAHN
jgi:hypothetical protein